jgi:RNA polymerase sigma-32 factor
LVQQGFLGLCRAVERYEPERGLRFWTYARWWVRAMVRSYVWSNRRIVPLSSNRTHRHVAAKLRKVESRIGGDRAELAKQLEVSEEDIDRVRQALGSGDVSLDWTVSPAMTPVANDTSPEVEVADGRNQQRREELVGGALDVLDEREREIIERRYLQESPPTLADLGQEMGISRERVRQLCERALGKLKNAVTEEEPAAAALVA